MKLSIDYDLLLMYFNIESAQLKSPFLNLQAISHFAIWAIKQNQLISFLESRPQFQLLNCIVWFLVVLFIVMSY